MSKDWKEIESNYYMFVVKRQPIVIVKGEGTYVWDDNGKEYIDFTSGWAVNNVGHSNKYVSKAISEQANTLLQTSNQFYTVPQLKLAEILVENSCLDKIFICNSGTEANEGAIKLARKFGKKNLNNAFEIITAFNSFHGRTMMSVAATGQPKYQDIFQPIPTGFKHVNYNDLEEIKKATDDKTVAVMLEPVQGEGGVNIPDKNYLKNVRKWCDENGILLIFDEVQTGLGRLGKLFGYQVFDVEPDIMTLAKGLGGGVPIGAFLAKDQACAFDPGDHGSTFGGNALTCSAAFASTEYIINEKIVDKVSKMENYFRNELNKIKNEFEIIQDIRGIGLLWAIQFNSEISADLVSICNDNGLLTNPLRPDAIRLMPPLTVSIDEASKAFNILKKSLDKLSS
ncbi:MAG: aspartate aminotransferase family protein [Chloroflexi bacterium]|nr:aspartate aminotransferase family protein [Chloroflexota bacterium]|tara:strand:+ start:488 stop:1678 length:1191 start_codon:yes stop_codon:yes gene_type:complete